MGIAFSITKTTIFCIQNHKDYKWAGGHKQPKLPKQTYLFGDAPRSHQNAPRRPQDASKGPPGRPKAPQDAPKTGCMFWNFGVHFGEHFLECFGPLFREPIWQKNLNRKSKKNKNQKKNGVEHAAPKSAPGPSAWGKGRIAFYPNIYIENAKPVIGPEGGGLGPISGSLLGPKRPRNAPLDPEHLNPKFQNQWTQKTSSHDLKIQGCWGGGF